MQKLKLDLDSVRVETFATASAAPVRRGTVAGQEVGEESAFCTFVGKTCGGETCSVCSIVCPDTDA